MDEVIELSPREKQVLEGLRDGLSRKQIARNLCISKRTVSAYIYNTRRKLATQSTITAVILAIDYGLIQKYNRYMKDCAK
jgi:DNA-binding NarL/FixJ family response regulator